MQAKLLELEHAERDKAREHELQIREQEQEQEMKLKQLELENEDNARNHAYQLQQLNSKPPTETQIPRKTDLLKYVKLIPSFPDEDPKAFFREFESTVTHFEIPPADSVWLIKPKLSDKALTVCNHIEDNTNYTTVKEAILAAYSITKEGYSQVFRNLSKLQYQIYTEFASDKIRALKRWLKSAAVSSYDDLFNIIAIEEFLRKVPHSINVHIIDKEETDLIKAAKLADNYALIQKSPTRERKHLHSNVRLPGSSEGAEATKTRDGKLAKSNPVCFFCKKSGHVITNCPDPKCKVAKMAANKPVASIQTLPPKANDPFQPFRSTFKVSLGPGQPKHPVRIARDTCAAQSLNRQSALSNISDNYTGEMVYLRDFHNPFPAHLARVDLRCGLVQRFVKVGVSEDKKLPIPNVDLTLGNDRSLVYPSVIICMSPLSETPTADFEQNQPGLLPSCAITRSPSKAGKISEPALPPQSLIPTIFTEQSLKEAQ